MDTVRTYLVDDNELFLNTLSVFLANSPRISVVGAARSGAEGVAEADRLRPDLVLIDLVMPGMNGLEALRRIKAAPNPPRVIVMTFQNESAFRDEALSLGADGFVNKMDLGQRLTHVVEGLFPYAGVRS